MTPMRGRLGPKELVMSWFDDLVTWGRESVDAFTGKAQVDAMREANQTNIELANTAVQRRAADLQAAGMNPLLAAGSSAGGQVQSTGGNSSGNPVGAVLGLMRGLVDVQKTIADSGLVELQKGKVSADTAGQVLENSFRGSMNPLALSKMELEVNFDRAANPEKLKQIGLALKGADLDNINKEIDSRAKEAGIDLTKVQEDKAFYDMVEQRFRVGLDPSGFVRSDGVDQYPLAIETAAKLIAMRTAGITLANEEAFLEALPPGSRQAVEILNKFLGIFKK